VCDQLKGETSLTAKMRTYQPKLVSKKQNHDRRCLYNVYIANKKTNSRFCVILSGTEQSLQPK